MKKIAFVFLSLSVILLSMYSYKLLNEISARNVYHEEDSTGKISKTEGNNETEGEQVVDRKTKIIEDSDLEAVFDFFRRQKDHSLILVNKWNLLSENYQPTDIKDAAGIVPSTKEQMLLQKEAYEALITMFNGAKNEGIEGLFVVSGYRPYSYQSQLYNAKVNAFSSQYDLETAKEKASEIVAIPGTSEHQTGLAIDFSSAELLKTADPLVEEFKNTPQGEWLYNNSWKYGFVLRYLPEKKEITGIISEPWHFRYVGIPHAQYMTLNHLCLEEYIEHVKEEKVVIFEDYFGNKYLIGFVQKENHDILLSEEFSLEKVMNVSEIGEEEYIITLKL